MDKDIYRAFALELAAEAERQIMPFFHNSEMGLEIKADDTPVTLADRRAEEVMREMIGKKFPAHGVLGEEFGSDRAQSDFVWVLDPIDGTKAFVTGCPLFGTLIGLMAHGRPVLGVIHLPALGQTCWGDGDQTWHQGQRAHVRAARPLHDATVLASDVFMAHKYRNGEAFETTVRQARLFRTWGDCYGYVLVATGWADAILDPLMNPWDLLPLIPIIRGAGGCIGGWAGEDPTHSDASIAATPGLYEDLLRRLNPPPPLES